MCEFFYALRRSRFSRVQFSGSVKRGGAPPFLDSGVVVDGVLSERAITEDHRAYSLPPTDVVNSRSILEVQYRLVSLFRGCDIYALFL